MSRAAKLIHSFLALVTAAFVVWMSISTSEVPNHHPWLLIKLGAGLVVGILLYVGVYCAFRIWLEWIRESVRPQRNPVEEASVKIQNVLFDDVYLPEFKKACARRGIEFADDEELTEVLEVVAMLNSVPGPVQQEESEREIYMSNRKRAREIAESLNRVDASIRPEWRDPLLVGYATGLIERHLDEVVKESTKRAQDQIKGLRARILQLEKERTRSEE